MTNTPRPKDVLSIGRVSETVIPENWPYQHALRHLLFSAHDLFIKIDVDAFYSEVPIELHNFVDSITYRFLSEDGVGILAYCVSTHYGGSYVEVDFEGAVLRSWGINLPISQSKDVLSLQNARMRDTLGFL